VVVRLWKNQKKKKNSIRKIFEKITKNYSKNHFQKEE